jgi:hypothetical protein
MFQNNKLKMLTGLEEESVQKLKIEVYDLARQTLEHVIRGMLLNLHDRPGIEMRIIRNFFAKSTMLVRSIYSLWGINAFQECNILYRCLLDRYFYLHVLVRDKSFELFEEASFMEKFGTARRARNDDKFSHQIALHPALNPEHEIRYKELKQKPQTWKRPDAKEVVKSMKRDFFYQYGFDYASKHVHPQANDGEQDFETLTELRSGTQFFSHAVVLHNSLFILCLIIMDTFRDKDIKIIQPLSDFFDAFLDFLESGSLKFVTDYEKLMKVDLELWIPKSF